MRHYFLDTSSLAKLFVVEPGTTRMRSIIRAAEAGSASVKVSVCDLAHAEAVAALRQIVERGEGGRRGISKASLRQALPVLASVVSERSAFGVVRASDVIPEAAQIAARRQVKGADAVHLAAAQRVRRRLNEGEEFWFVSADVRQAAAARDEGMPVLDPTL